MKEALQKQHNITVKNPKHPQPQLIIKGVERGHKKQDILRELLRQNKDIKQRLTEENFENTKVVTVKKTKNSYKENVIIETDPTTFRYLIRKERATLEFTKIYTSKNI